VSRDLPPHRIDIWFCADQLITDSDLLNRYDRDLEPHEREQQRRFYFEEHRHRYLVTRALVRNVLSLYAPAVCPADWRFACNEHGKPRVAGPLAQLVRFNLSHARGMIVMAVTRSREVGVDVEPNVPSAPIDVAAHYFATREAQDLLALAEPFRAARFYELWTLKEAYVKARGTGLTLPLSSFNFDLTSDAGIELSFEPGAADEASRWALWLLNAGSGHKVAVAVDAAGAGTFELTVRNIVPGLRHQIARWPLLRCTTPRRAALGERGVPCS
jgi:4'-phosphopantetheinyl transferase